MHDGWPVVDPTHGRRRISKNECLQDDVDSEDVGSVGSVAAGVGGLFARGKVAPVATAVP